MNTEALLTMLLTQGIVVSFAVYFFYKVLTIKPKKESDSFSKSDDEIERQKEK